MAGQGSNGGTTYGPGTSDEPVTTADDCTAAEFVAGVASVSDLQTSAALINSSIPIIGIPNNSSLFLPTDSAWAAFRAANGAVCLQLASHGHLMMGEGPGGPCAPSCLRLSDRPDALTASLLTLLVAPTPHQARAVIAEVASAMHHTVNDLLV